MGDKNVLTRWQDWHESNSYPKANRATSYLQDYNSKRILYPDSRGGMGTGNMMPMAQTFKIPTLTHEEILETEQFDQFVVTVSK